MNAEEFLKTKGIGRPTIKAVRLPHKYKNIELELIPLMEEYAELKLLGTTDDVGQNEQLCQCKMPSPSMSDKCSRCNKKVPNE